MTDIIVAMLKMSNQVIFSYKQVLVKKAILDSIFEINYKTYYSNCKRIRNLWIKHFSKILLILQYLINTVKIL